MALTDQEKSSLRRHLKYGNLGLSASLMGGGTVVANAGLNMYAEWGDLEMRLDLLSPIDEATLTGRPYGLIFFSGLDPNPGDQLILAISGGGISAPQTITTTAASGDNLDAFARKVCTNISRNQAINQARIDAKATSGTGRTGITRPLSQIHLVGRSAFNVEITSSTGNIGASIDADGSTLTDIYQTIKKTDIHGYLPICNKLYSQIGTATDRMGVDKADVFTARKKEYEQRVAAYTRVIMEMADFLHIPLNSNVNGRNSNIGHL